MDKLRTSWRDSKFTRNSSYLLDRNENCDIRMNDVIMKFLNGLTSSSFIRYPNLNKAYKALERLGYDPDNVLLTSGAEHAIRAIIEQATYTTIAFPEPTYGMLRVFAGLYNLTVNTVNYDSNRTFNHDDLKAEIIYLANPDNPTGSVVSNEFIEQLCERAKLVILDETYVSFYGMSAISLLEKYSNLYIVRSFSKDYGIAGIRLGMIISHKDNIARLNEFKPAYEINSIACEYLDFVANNSNEMRQSVERILIGKSLIESELRKSFVVHETHTNFILVSFDEILYETIKKVIAVSVVKINNSKFIRITSPDITTAERLISHGLFRRHNT